MIDCDYAQTTSKSEQTAIKEKILIIKQGLSVVSVL